MNSRWFIAITAILFAAFLYLLLSASGAGITSIFGLAFMVWFLTTIKKIIIDAKN